MTPQEPEEKRGRRAGLNEALFREVNEQIERLEEGLGVEAGPITIVCECGDGACRRRLEVDHATYDRIRADAHRFFVAPGHEEPDVEDVVERLETCLVVRKRRGGAAEVAEQTDPRR